MSRLDRGLQYQILELAAEDYPNHITKIPAHLSSVDDKTLLQNIAYLNEEGLIRGGIDEVMAGHKPDLKLAQATKDAMNLLSEDGSISASLKVINVKLHDETLSALSAYINQNVSDPEERKVCLQRLKELPADATKHIVLKLLDQGLAQMPNAIHWLQTMLHQA
ncbi:hypothetical protein CMV60_19950 [Serratia marcescens]|nr:hypothetical protein CMV60_19950 [Serratia marcescens]